MSSWEGFVPFRQWRQARDERARQARIRLESSGLLGYMRGTEPAPVVLPETMELIIGEGDPEMEPNHITKNLGDTAIETNVEDFDYPV